MIISLQVTTVVFISLDATTYKIKSVGNSGGTVAVPLTVSSSNASVGYIRQIKPGHSGFQLEY
jgi:hypothetical protein